MRSLHRLVLLSTLTVAVAVGCGTQEDAGDGSAAASTGEAAIPFDEVLPELAAQGIHGTVKKLFDPRLADLDVENRYYLEISFGKISQSQHALLTAFFGGHSKVPFDAKRSYDVTDFLHPAMQAVVNQTFTTESYSGTDVGPLIPEELAEDEALNELAWNGVAIETNCFNTTTEIIRQTQAGRRDTQYLLYIPDREQAHFWYTDDQYSDRVSESDLKYGDVLTVKQPQVSMMNEPWLVHTVTVISKELVFEKTNATSEDPYRVSLRKDVLGLYNRIVEGPVFDYRRFGPGKKPIPVPTVPTRELNEQQQAVLHKAHPDINVENVTRTREFGRDGSWMPTDREILPAEVIINPKSGRGIFKARQSVLARFVGLKPGR